VHPFLTRPVPLEIGDHEKRDGRLDQSHFTGVKLTAVPVIRTVRSPKIYEHNDGLNTVLTLQREQRYEAWVLNPGIDGLFARSRIAEVMSSTFGSHPRPVISTLESASFPKRISAIPRNLSINIGTSEAVSAMAGVIMEEIMQK
jgi:hypothetical protein